MNQVQIGFRYVFSGIFMLLIGLAYGLPVFARAIHNDNDAFVLPVMLWIALSIGVLIFGVIRVAIGLVNHLKNQQNSRES